jgi:exosortase/archaeosortase family protein
MRWQQLRFPVLFGFWLAAFSLLGQAGWFRTHLRVPVAEVLAQTAGIALNAAGIQARVNGDLVTAGGFSAVVHSDCDGIVLLGLFLAAVLAFPTRSRLATLPATLLGVAALVILNWLRVVALIVTGYLDPELFEMTHVYAWQGALMLGTMVVWILWANHVLRLDAAAQEGGASVA